MSPDPQAKRKASDTPISPPPLKRTIQSGTTKNAVANFFKPASQKPKERTAWSERSDNPDRAATLLIGRYEPENSEEKPSKRHKIAAFDLDSTLIATSSGKKHASAATDWRWWHASVPGKLKELYDEGYQVVILSNQGGMTLHFDANHKGPKTTKRVPEFKQKCSAVLNHLDIPITLYAATGKDIYRKPRTGMWQEMLKDYGLETSDINLGESFFVGDAGGRTAVYSSGSVVAKDFSCSDRNLAHNVGIDFKTPEEYFLGEAPRKFVRDFDLEQYPFEEEALEHVFEKKNKQDIVISCGPPGAGKSTFYWKCLKPLGYERVNQDTLKSRDKCLKFAKEALEEGKSIAIDNTNADQDTRKIWIDLANNHNVPIRCVWFTTPIHLCEHNDAARSLNKSLNPEDREVLPKMAFTGFQSRYKAPQLKEGFQDITEVDFKFRGSKEEYSLWGRYWL